MDEIVAKIVQNLLFQVEPGGARASIVVNFTDATKRVIAWSCDDAAGTTSGRFLAVLHTLLETLEMAEVE